LVNAFIPVVISGILFGLVAIAFMTSLRFFARMNARLNRPVYQSLTIAVLSVIGISIIIPEALGLGTQTLAAMLNTESSFAFVIFLLLAKILITSICLGFGFFGGVFFPSLLIGASAGVILAKFFSIFGYDDLSVSLALAGMASVAACVVGAPLATIFIVLELTMSYDFTLIALLAVIVSQVVSSNLFGNSFFDRQLLDRGIDLRFGRGKLHLTQVIVSDSTHADYVSAKPHWTAGVVLEKLNASRQTEAYCVSEGGDLEGKINIIGLLDHPEDTIVKDIMDPNPLNLCTDQSMLEAIKIASNFVGESIPVLQNDTRQMAGIITESDLFAVYLKIQSQVQDVER
jgi:CIC family chloride channel protein